MKMIPWIGAMLGLALPSPVLIRAADPAPAKMPQQLLQSRVEAARKTFDVVWLNARESVNPLPERVYIWSCRLLDAERELNDRKADRIAAIKAHRDRMRDLEKLVRDRYRTRVVTIDLVTACEFYVSEADIWAWKASNE